MLKKIFCIIFCLFIFRQAAFSNEIPVKITPTKLITTCDLKLTEGDPIEFSIVEDVKTNSKTVFKKGEKVYATLIGREENDFLGLVASVYIADFYIKSSNGKRIKLKGTIYQEGKCHDIITGFFQILLILIRGGEVKMVPNKNIFTIYYEGAN